MIMTNKAHSIVSINKILLCTLLAISLFISLSSIGQKKELPGMALSRDTIIMDFLLRHQQFYDIPVSDTSNIKRYEMVRYHFFCDKIATASKKGKRTSLYGFGSNYSHSRNYLLIESDNCRIILGTSTLEKDLPRLYKFFGELKGAITVKQKLSCYEFLIRNYAMDYPPYMHLIKDTSYKKNKS